VTFSHYKFSVKTSVKPIGDWQTLEQVCFVRWHGQIQIGHGQKTRRICERNRCEAHTK